MRKLAFAALASFALVQLGAGCIFVSDDDDPIVEAASLDVTWELVQGDPATSNTLVPCPPGGIAQLVVNDTAGNLVIMADFLCNDKIGGFDNLVLGEYDVFVNILDGTDTLAAQSDLAPVSLTKDGELVTIDLKFSADRGQFGVTWTIEGAKPADVCDSIDGGEVVLRATLIGGDGIPLDTVAECKEGEIITNYLVLGDYTTFTLLHDSVGVVLDESPETTETLDFGDQFNELEPFDFIPVAP